MINSLRIMDLIRYDVNKKCFVASQTAEVEYWPDTNIPKSVNNDFNWRNRPSYRAKRDTTVIHKRVTRNKAFTVYSKAQASK